MSRELDELLAVMARLRAADGCPWDREQTTRSLAPFVLEEAYEVVAAIEAGEPAPLCDELGDLLLQVVFHAQIAAEQNAFDFAAVADGIRKKLIRRHPHLFAPDSGATAMRTAAEQTISWENIKAEERRAARESRAGGDIASQLDNIPPNLPALLRADKLSKRAARVGFDFEHAAQAADKVAEELQEVREAAAANASAAPSPEVCAEVGDLLFAAVNLARKLNVDPESALRAANAKFERRFRGMERLASARGVVFGDLDLAAQERLWQEMKRGE
jgi:ATP diphosphatase